MIKAIFACDEFWGIGKNNSLPWPHNPEDLKWFKEQTDGDVVVMGKNTWESLPIKPLPNRLNCVISSDPNITKGYNGRYTGKSNIERTIKEMIENRFVHDIDVWIIGGAQLFSSCINIVDEIHLSRIEGTYDCDTFLPKMKIMRDYIKDSYIFTENGLLIEKWVKR